MFIQVIHKMRQNDQRSNLQVAVRMTDLQDLIFVPWEDEKIHEAEDGESMVRQVQTAVQTMAQQCQRWEP